MRFRIDKCGVLAMHIDEEPEYKGITIGIGEVTDETDGDGCEYLGIMERSDICQEHLKRSVKTEWNATMKVRSGGGRKGELKRETESLLCPPQEQTIRANSIKYIIDRISETTLYRFSNENVESVTHITLSVTHITV